MAGVLTIILEKEIRLDLNDSRKGLYWRGEESLVSDYDESGGLGKP